VRMKYIVPLLVMGWVLAAVWSLAADSFANLSLYREEEIVTTQYPGEKQTTTVTRSWIKGVKMRTDTGDGVEISLIRPDQDKVYNINLQRKMYAESPLSVYRKAAKLSLAMLGNDPTYQWTGRQKKIGSWNCREGVVADETAPNGERMKTVWWVSQDVGMDKQLLRHIMSLTMGMELDESTLKAFEKLTNIPGYPVQTETSFTRGGFTLKTVQTLKKIERRTIEDKIFELPEGLTKLNVPVPEGM